MASCGQLDPHGAPSAGRLLSRRAVRALGPARGQRTPTCAFGSQPGSGKPAAPHGGGREVAASAHGARVNAAAALAAESPALEAARAVDDAAEPSQLDSERDLLAKLFAGAPAHPFASEPPPQRAEAERRLQGSQATTSGRLDHFVDLVPSTRGADRSRARGAAPSRSGLVRRPVAVAAAAARADASAQHLRALELQQGQGLQRGAAAGALSPETAADTAFLAGIRATLQEGRRKKKGSRRDDTVSMFLNGLGQTAVLGKEQESHLARVLQQGLELERKAAAVEARLGRRPSQEELASVAGLASGAEVAQQLANRHEAKDLMLQFNLRLVISIAKKYCNKGVELSDLIPEGVDGLSKAIDKFDPSKGFKFSTYAHWWIRQSVTRSVSTQARVVRLPVHVCETLYKINKIAESLNGQPGREEPASFEEIANAVGLPVVRIIQLLKVSRAPQRSDTQPLALPSMKELPMDDMLDMEADASGLGEDPGAEETEDFIKHNLNLILSTLPKRERNILRLRYGLLTLEGADPEVEAAGMNLHDLGHTYGLSRERIRQIEDKALQQLRKPWRQQLLRELNSGERLSACSLNNLAAATSMAAEDL